MAVKKNWYSLKLHLTWINHSFIWEKFSDLLYFFHQFLLGKYPSITVIISISKSNICILAPHLIPQIRASSASYYLLPSNYLGLFTFCGKLSHSFILYLSTKTIQNSVNGKYFQTRNHKTIMVSKVVLRKQ